MSHKVSRPITRGYFLFLFLFLCVLQNNSVVLAMELETWPGYWVGHASVNLPSQKTALGKLLKALGNTYPLPSTDGPMECSVVARFDWVDNTHTAVQGTPEYTCGDLIYKPYHRFFLNPKGEMEMEVNLGLGNMDFYVEQHGNWHTFFWHNHWNNPKQMMLGVLIQNMAVHQFHGPRRMNKIITFKLPFQKNHYILEGEYLKISDE